MKTGTGSTRGTRSTRATGPARVTRRHSTGAALLIAMLIAAIVTSIVAGLLWQQQLWLRQYDFQRDQAQAHSLARSGISWARLILFEDARTSAIDHFGEQWAIRLPLTPLENGEIGGAIADQQGLFNVNALVKGGTLQPDVLARYTRLLVLLGLPPALGPALADWLDVNDEPTPGGGVEDAHYVALTPARVAANRPLATIDELGLVAGYTQEAIARLRPFVTALPATASGANAGAGSAAGAVNINTAPPEVLAATIDGLGLDDANKVVASRASRVFSSTGEFRARLASIASGIAVNESAVRVTSDAFVVRVDVRQGEVRTTAYALLVREPNAWPRIVWQMLE